MKKRLFILGTLLFLLVIMFFVMVANAGRIPKWFEALYDFPAGDKAGHFILFGLLSYLVNRSALTLLPEWDPVRVVLVASLSLFLVIGLEEWSQSLFPARTLSLVDLTASYAGVVLFAWLAYQSEAR
jgi:hypothetical protein